MSSTEAPLGGLVGTRYKPALSVEVSDGIAIITFDLPNESVNKLNRTVKDEFVALVTRLERDTTVHAGVLISGKPDVWIAGADIEEFQELRTATDAERLSRDGQMLLDSVERLRIPIVAAIHGACLGGGLETALACRYRIATDHPKTILGLPEVQLGLIPGAGGTQRLPRRIGLTNALDLILTGKTVRGSKALKLGLIDELVHPSILRSVAIQRAHEVGEGRRRSEKHSGGLKGALLDGNPAGRALVLRKAREQTLAKSRGHYPALIAAIDVIAAGYEKGVAHGYREESRRFGELAMTDVSRQLIFLFFATNELKKDPGVEPSQYPELPVSAFEPLPVEKIAIIGAGFMGAGIASIAVTHGSLVRLKDADHGRVAKGYAAVRDILKERLTKRQITKVQYSDYMALLGGTVDYSGFGNVDLVIEAVFEDLAVKHQVLREAEASIHPSAIFASNTSTIPIGQIAQASSRPERVIGMHFFSPVHKMPLLEVITTADTYPQVTATVVAYGKKLGKTVIVVNDGPGFYANRILSPYINEAGILLDQGVAVDIIDRALVDFGFPVGPITLIDEVGLDVATKAGKIMAEAFPERLQPAKSIQAVVAAGRYGRKSKKGFYTYDKEGKKSDVDPSVYSIFLAPGSIPMAPSITPAAPETPAYPEMPAVQVQQRTVLAMLNEAARCLSDGIIRSARDGDVGAVFGIGFPPFRGGPFRYMDSLGIRIVVQRLEDLNARFPGRFEPAELLLDMARRNQSFYADEHG
ncbi:MAG TPA: fatty acid oxidation complex subunit alpha FadJ [Gemmatimonadaceae bacterium]|jgi:3-hydroxyacyl-CoA dehydrogenase/enoyl-CoA hydratase/3-hydroxybutyryl-CoA epimerase|nr:fatty acid oxidation complex subunit alpha FadJ [Gemmatimonadaceae bacterium]